LADLDEPLPAKNDGRALMEDGYEPLESRVKLREKAKGATRFLGWRPA
jgi:hypothetical protein